MNVLVSWGSKMGGTEGIARMVADELRHAGHHVTLLEASRVEHVELYDAAIIGGALYAFRWHAHASRLVRKNVAKLRRLPVWLFSSGPLDASADAGQVAPVAQVSVLLERIGAQGHVTFGGRLPADAKGFPASAMAKTKAGDWRNPERIRAWGRHVAHALPHAKPRSAHEPVGHSVWRLLAHALLGWGICALAGLLLSQWGVLGLELLLAPAVFVGVAYHYFKRRGAREALPTAAVFAALGMGLNVGLAIVLVLRGQPMLASLALTLGPFVLIFFTTWMTGALCERFVGSSAH